ncbi:hypothetical protein B0H10DRAFT_577717 [Mycena sp. CBHHK59/15]|nr:hypothetical protein B0H10DRAFT_577717 [Mycena sp. CBHHK59/15]
MKLEVSTIHIPNVRPKRILVIGGGPSGLVTLRNLRERGRFDDVQLVERRADVGGVWYLPGGCTPDPFPSPAYPRLIGNVLPEFLSFSAFPPFPTPPCPVQPFPTLAETHLYLHAFAAPLRAQGGVRLNTEVRRVEELPGGRGWRVVMRDWGVRDACGEDSGADNAPPEFEETWDAVVVAVSWYDHPVYPPTPGLSRLVERGFVWHAKSWRNPAGYEGLPSFPPNPQDSSNSDIPPQRVLVVGNANSGNDIAAQLAAQCRTVVPDTHSHAAAPDSEARGAWVYQSIRRPNFPGFPSLPDARIVRVPPVVEYILRDGGGIEVTGDTDNGTGLTNDDEGRRPTFDARLADGTLLRALDAVWLGTGYRPCPDFVHVRARDGATAICADDTRLAPLLSPHTPAGAGIPQLHRHILYAHNPALAFVGTAYASYTPFTLADVGSTWLALAWSTADGEDKENSTGRGSGSIAYPTTLAGLLQFEAERRAAVEVARAEVAAAGSQNSDSQTPPPPSSLLSYTVLGPLEEAYAAGLRADAVHAAPALASVLPVWSAARTAEREAMFGVKRRALEAAVAGVGDGGE